MSEKLSPEAKKIGDARKAAAAELKAIDRKDRPLTDNAVRRLASARLFAENIELRIVAGDAVAAAEVRSADQMIQDARGAVHAPMDLRVSFVGGVVGMFKCQHCHQENRIEDYEPPLIAEKPVQPVVSPPSSGVAVVHPSVAGEAAPPKIGEGNQSPRDITPERRDPGSIHDASYRANDGNGGVVTLHPPIKRLQPREPWTGYPL